MINVFFDGEVFAVFGFGDFDFDGFGVGGEGFEVGEFDFADDDGFAEFDNKPNLFLVFCLLTFRRHINIIIFYD